mmetsp:Transcript_2930/g.6891  ORF Transcript_2930/g.6891 Transcript_2930/m.6891 type:complete len:201 (-) Transcript_2930:254-856(-)
MRKDRILPSTALSRRLAVSTSSHAARRPCQFSSSQPLRREDPSRATSIAVRIRCRCAWSGDSSEASRHGRERNRPAMKAATTSTWPSTTASLERMVKLVQRWPASTTTADNDSSGEPRPLVLTTSPHSDRSSKTSRATFCRRCRSRRPPFSCNRLEMFPPSVLVSLRLSHRSSSSVGGSCRRSLGPSWDRRSCRTSSSGS